MLYVDERLCIDRILLKAVQNKVRRPLVRPGCPIVANVRLRDFQKSAIISVRFPGEAAMLLMQIYGIKELTWKKTQSLTLGFSAPHQGTRGSHHETQRIVVTGSCVPDAIL